MAANQFLVKSAICLCLPCGPEILSKSPLVSEI